MKKCITVLCFVLCFALLLGCATEQPDREEETQLQTNGDELLAETEDPETPGAPEVPIGREPLPELLENTIQATITMEDGGEIVLELFPDLAPQTVRNFVYLARQGFYDGLKFHRIMNGFMIQGGCPYATGTGNAGHFIKGEFEVNGFVNDLSHTRGVISMARRADPFFDSAGSQFFIMHGDFLGLDGDYAGFGHVISGMDIVDVLAQTPNSGPNGQVDPELMPIIRSITIDSDMELPPPDKI